MQISISGHAIVDSIFGRSETARLVSSLGDFQSRDETRTAKSKVGGIGIFASALKEVAVDDRNVAIALVDYIKAADVVIPGFAGRSFSGHKADAVEASEQTR